MLGFIICSLDVSKIFYGQHTGIDHAQYTTSPESFHASSKLSIIEKRQIPSRVLENFQSLKSIDLIVLGISNSFETFFGPTSPSLTGKLQQFQRLFKNFQLIRYYIQASPRQEHQNFYTQTIFGPTSPSFSSISLNATMPISPLTIFDLHKTTAHFDFLLTAPYGKIETIPPNARSCAICHKPFEKDLWQLGTIVNRPVELECGHNLGIKCLAHLVFASDFRNRCPVCSAQVISDSFERNPSKQSWKVMVPLLRTLTMCGGDDVAFNKERALEVL